MVLLIKLNFYYKCKFFSDKGSQKNIKLISAEDESTLVVKEILTLYLSGWGAGKIASYLNKQGIEPPSNRIKNFARKKFGKWIDSICFRIILLTY